jgi:hypothetical protein
MSLQGRKTRIYFQNRQKGRIKDYIYENCVPCGGIYLLDVKRFILKKRKKMFSSMGNMKLKKNKD